MMIHKCDRCGQEYKDFHGIKSTFKPILPDDREVAGNFVTGITLRYEQLLRNNITVTGCFRTIDLCEDCLKEIMDVLEEEHMTNRKWLESLPDDEFYETLREHFCDDDAGCSLCAYIHTDHCIKDMYCQEGFIKWLQAKHKDE